MIVAENTYCYYHLLFTWVNWKRLTCYITLSGWLLSPNHKVYWENWILRMISFFSKAKNFRPLVRVLAGKRYTSFYLKEVTFFPQIYFFPKEIFCFGKKIGISLRNFAGLSKVMSKIDPENFRSISLRLNILQKNL